MKANLRSFTVAMLTYPFVLGAAMLLTGIARQYEWPSALHYLVALLPMLPAGVAVLLLSRAVKDLDELQRRIQLEALAFSLGGVVLFCLTLGMLALAGLEAPNWAWVAGLAATLWGFGQWLAARRYQ
jgi:hypothetical protein